MHSDSYESVSPEESNSAGDHLKHPQDVDYKSVSEFDRNASYLGHGTHQSSQEQGASHHRTLAPWYREILACLLVLGAPLAMTGTLYSHDGQVAPQWPLKITLNALLSIYSVVFRTALGFVTASCIGQLQWTWFDSERPLYDVVRYTEASQGAWGSICWLYTHHLRQPLTALGAVILVLAVALDPFVQQLVKPVACAKASGDVPTLPRTNYISDATKSVEFAKDFDIAMERAIMAPGTGVEAHCLTGNCTFPEEYGTVAYCSRCEDSSAELTVETRCSPDAPDKFITKPQDCPVNSTYIVQTSLPEGFYISDYGTFTKLNVSYRLDSEGSYLYPIDPQFGAEMFKMDIIWNQTDITFESPRPEMVTMRLIAGKTPFSDDHLDIMTGLPIPGCDVPNPGNDWRCKGYGAATCTFTPCVRMYNATVINGYLTETVVSDSGTLQWGVGKDELYGQNISRMLDTYCITQDEKHRLSDLGYNIDPKQRWLGFNTSDGDAPSNGTLATKALSERKCLYSISSEFTRQIAEFDVEAYVCGSVRGIGTVTSNNGVHVRDVPLTDHFMGELLPRRVYNSGNIDMEHIETTFADLANSLTRFLRTHGGENYSAPAVGEAYYYSTCIEVRWVWLTFPAALAVLTVALLSFVVRMSHVQGKPVWKSSPLVWIHQSFGQGGRPLGYNGTGIPTLAELEKKSKQVPVSVN
ncbi:hypothetical protein PG996_003361 [Apiospora saccharicola]|uniref:Uncharacterized protein n=1 Tax=Apiospora saccharicola TaxID=335842 RepID=A0ABR1W120_9PEZI